MKNLPETLWVRGRDPLETTWFGDHANVDPFALNWNQVASLLEEDSELQLSIGSDNKGKLHAYRIRGRIEGTARNLMGEIGWSATEEFAAAFPQISSKQWSDNWLRFVEGDIEGKELSKLLLENTKPIQIFNQSKKKPIWARISLIILMALLLSFAAGWYSKKTPIPPAPPPCEKCHLREVQERQLDEKGGRKRDQARK